MKTFKKKLSCSLLTCLFFFTSKAQSSAIDDNLFLPKPSAVVYYSPGSISVDGGLSDSAWSAIPWITHFTDITGTGPKPLYETKFKLLWDNQNLYIAALLATPHIWSNINENDAAIFMEDALEIFIDPDGDTHNYFELEINANNKVMDLFMTKPYRDGGTSLLSWDVKDWLHEVKMEGSLNNGNDSDKYWTIEMAIPFKSIRLNNSFIPSKHSTWRMNFFRVFWDAEFAGGKYAKKKNSQTGKDNAPHHWTWSPQGLNNIHYPERWGYIQFSYNNIPSANDTIQLPSTEKWKDFLWLVYYKQKQFYSKTGRYASSLAALSIDPGKLAAIEKQCEVKLETTSKQFILTVTARNKAASVQIDQEGKIISKEK